MVAVEASRHGGLVCVMLWRDTVFGGFNHHHFQRVSERDSFSNILKRHWNISGKGVPKISHKIKHKNKQQQQHCYKSLVVLKTVRPYVSYTDDWKEWPRWRCMTALCAYGFRRGDVKCDELCVWHSSKHAAYREREEKTLTFCPHIESKLLPLTHVNQAYPNNKYLKALLYRRSRRLVRGAGLQDAGVLWTNPGPLAPVLSVCLDRTRDCKLHVDRDAQHFRWPRDHGNKTWIICRPVQSRVWSCKRLCGRILHFWQWVTMSDFYFFLAT